MSYAKLFSSILSSTIWLEDHHIVRVWIALLAMKDQDGIVEASIPGLAHQARVTVAEAEEALQKFLSPDPYSRTPEHEGRRIAPVDGGWIVLNHEKYRMKEAAEERRQKEAARSARRRAEQKPTAGDRARPDPSGPDRDRPDPTADDRKSPERPPSDTETEHPEGERGPDQRPGSSRSGADPDQQGGRDHDQDPVDLAGTRRSAPAVTPGDPRADERRRLVRVLGRLHVEIFNRVRDEIGAKVPAMQPVGEPAERALAELLRDQVTLAGFEEKARHVLAVREAEARRTRSTKYLGASVWAHASFGVALQMEVGEDRRRGDRAPAVPAAGTPRADHGTGIRTFADAVVDGEGDDDR